MNIINLLKSFKLFFSNSDDSVNSANWLGGNYVSDAAPIVIGGSARSGTTLLRVMLDSHRDICCGPETNLFLPKNIDIDILASKFDMPHKKVAEIFQSAQSRAEFITLFSREYCRLTGKRRWAEKRPKNITQLDYIFRAFPDVRFIHMTRDGRDVACSLRTFPRHKVKHGKLVPLNTWKPLDTCIKRWSTAIEASRKYWSDSRYLQIRYEDLVLRTRPTLEKVLSFLDEAWDDDVLRYYEIQTASRDVLKFPQNPEAKEPIRKGAIGRWQRDFTSEDKNLFKQMAGDLLIELGYESSHNW